MELEREIPLTWRRFLNRECGKVWLWRLLDISLAFLRLLLRKMPPAKPKKGGARKMPPPLPKGEVLTDGIRKHQWVIGESIGKGGFGEIYVATQKGQDLSRAEHVIKIVSLMIECGGRPTLSRGHVI
jgi:hypothetical protein